MLTPWRNTALSTQAPPSPSHEALVTADLASGLRRFAAGMRGQRHAAIVSPGAPTPGNFNGWVPDARGYLPARQCDYQRSGAADRVRG